MVKTLLRGVVFQPIFSSGLAAILSLIAGETRAGSVSVDIQPYVNANLQTYTNGPDYPSGGTVLTNAGVSFTLAYYTDTTGLGAIQTPSAPPNSSFDIAVNIPNPTIVYVLVNSTFGAFGQTVGSIELKAPGLDYSVALIEGQDIRDHNNDGFNNVIGTGPLGSLYVNTFSFAVVRLDELEIVLPPSFTAAGLTDIILNGTGSGLNGEPFLAAVTVQSIPEPTSVVLMIVGMGMVSPWLRKRRHSPVRHGS